MNERLQRKRNETGDSVQQDIKPAVWVVLSADFRDEEYEGTYQECEMYLKLTCPTGKCGD